MTPSSVISPRTVESPKLNSVMPGSSRAGDHGCTQVSAGSLSVDQGSSFAAGRVANVNYWTQNRPSPNPGISDEFIPPILHLEQLDSVINVHDGDAILMAQKLAASLGLGVGISSGANFLGALMVQEELGPEAVVTTYWKQKQSQPLNALNLN